MKTAFALHSIIHKGKDVEPGTVMEIDEQNYDDLERLGAVRAPTEDELALYGLTESAKSSTDDPRGHLTRRRAFRFWSVTVVHFF